MSRKRKAVKDETEKQKKNAVKDESEKQKKNAVKDESEKKEKDQSENENGLDDTEFYEDMKNKKMDLQSFADEQGKEYAKSKGLNIFGRKKKDGESSKEVEKLTDRLKEKDEKIKELEGHVKELVAENRNQKNRIENEYRSRIKFAMEDFFRDFITIKDDFDKAIEFIPEKENGEKDSFTEGIRNLYQKMENIMLNHGLKSYSALGEHFDPSVHQAMSIIDVEGKEANEVVAEYVKGYKYYERILRAAMVVVASGNDPLEKVEEETEKVEESDDIIENEDNVNDADENVSENNLEDENKTE
ncbi:MAG TPA: nucleotide exchange factor GrpE [bacterium]|nr:nucleotide exchange factor GrpE [bacterium]